MLLQNDLQSKKKLLSFAALSSLILIIVAHTILGATPPSFPYYLKNVSEEEITKTISWHMAHNPREVLPEEHLCSIVQTQEKNDLQAKIHCPTLSISLTKKITRPLKDIIKEIPGYSHLIWKESKGDNEIYEFSALSYTLQKIDIQKDTSGLLGKELVVKAIFSNPLESEHIGDMLKSLNISKEQTSFRLNTEEVSQSNLSRIITFRENRYGYYLPIHEKIQ